MISKNSSIKTNQTMISHYVRLPHTKDHKTSTLKSIDFCIGDDDEIKFNFDCFLFKFKTDINFAALFLLFFLIILLDILLNSIVLISILKNKKRKRADICFMSNAIADLLMGLVVMPCTCILILFKHFPLSKYVCFLWNCIDFTTGTISMLHIMFISYDRYLSVSKPLQYTQKSTSNSTCFPIMRLPTAVILLFIWFLSIIAWIPIIFYLKTQDSTNLTSLDKATFGKFISVDCSLQTNPYVVIPHAILVYFIPMVLIIVFYSRTILIVQRKIRRRRRQSVVSSTRSRSEDTRSATGRCCCRKMKKNLKVEINNKIPDCKNDGEICEYFFEEVDEPTTTTAATSRTVSPSLINDNEKYLRVFENNQKLRMKFFMSKATENDENEKNSLQVPRRSCIAFKEVPKNELFLMEQDLAVVSSLIPSAYISIQSSAVLNANSKRERYVIYKLGIVMVTLIVCWLPFSLFWTIDSFCKGCISNYVYLASFWLAYLNSIFTPLILLYTNTKYRKTILCLKRCFKLPFSICRLKKIS
jgi:hypothetical protein